jgi:hypothetical protein
MKKYIKVYHMNPLTRIIEKDHYLIFLNNKVVFRNLKKENLPLNLNCAEFIDEDEYLKILIGAL